MARVYRTLPVHLRRQPTGYPQPALADSTGDWSWLGGGGLARRQASAPVLGGLARLARPWRWPANLVVLAPLIASPCIAEPAAWAHALLAATAFCLAAGAAYTVNDIHDRHADRDDPLKRRRPVADGVVPVSTAVLSSLGLASIGSAVAWRVGWPMLGCVAAYLGLQTLYTLVSIRHRSMAVAVGALGAGLRVAGGAVAIRVAPSPWLVGGVIAVCVAVAALRRRPRPRRAERLDRPPRFRTPALRPSPKR